MNGKNSRYTIGHSLGWHDDCSKGRVATMSVNLSRQAFDGGALQLKRNDADEILHEVHNTGFGDALLFRVSPDLVHRVLDVKGDLAKTAFAGWFLDVEDVLPNFRKSPDLSSLRIANDEPDWEVPASHKQP